MLWDLSGSIPALVFQRGADGPGRSLLRALIKGLLSVTALFSPAMTILASLLPAWTHDALVTSPAANP